MNVLSEEKKQQVLALGRLGWSLRRIEEATGVRRETASGYLKAAGIAVRRAADAPPATRGRQNRPVARGCPPTRADQAKPASREGVSTDLERVNGRQRRTASPTASACEPYRELIEAALRRRPQRDGDLAGPGRRPRLPRAATRA